MLYEVITVQTQQLVEQIQQLAAIDENSAPMIKPRDNAQDEEIRRLKKELRELLEREASRESLKPQHEYAPKDKQALPPPVITSYSIHYTKLYEVRSGR